MEELLVVEFDVDVFSKNFFLMFMIGICVDCMDNIVVFWVLVDVWVFELQVKVFMQCLELSGWKDVFLYWLEWVIGEFVRIIFIFVDG